MCRSATVAWAILAGTGLGWAQSPNAPDWRRTGAVSIGHPTGDAATGAVVRAWYLDGGLAVRTRTGKTFFTRDFEAWQPSSLIPPAVSTRERAGVAYRAEGDVLRSEDGGETWTNLTQFRGGSILGSPVLDVAVSPLDENDLVAANRDGVWRSLDGGLTWAGLNAGLPNLEPLRLLAVPGEGSDRALRIATPDRILEWSPGETAWSTTGAWIEPGIAFEARGEYQYLGGRDGRIAVMRAGAPRPEFLTGAGPVARIWIDPRDPSFAIAIAGARVFRTANGGAFWDDITGGLTAGELTGVTGDRASGSLYVAGEAGLFYTPLDFAPGAVTPAWRSVPLPSEQSRVRDVRLDPAANQIYVAIEGEGIFAALAPHRSRQPVLLSAADLIARPAAPGALMMIAGAGVTAALAGGRPAPILASTPNETHLQIPFDLEGSRLNLQLESASARWGVDVDLRDASPAIFVDRDGSAMVLDADSGVLTGAMHPLRSGARLQILATGLGRVRPEFPAGIEAPAINPPEVVSAVRVLLDGQPLTVTRKTLAPGYIGFYLVEAEMPIAVNAGTAELMIEAAGRASNRVRVYIEP
jgi:uncharacterized protein (TIGR03437 family)